MRMRGWAPRTGAGSSAAASGSSASARLLLRPALVGVRAGGWVGGVFAGRVTDA